LHGPSFHLIYTPPVDEDKGVNRIQTPSWTGVFLTLTGLISRVQYNSENLVWHCVRPTRVLVGHDRTLNYSQEGCCQLSQYYIETKTVTTTKSPKRAYAYSICVMVNKITQYINDNLYSVTVYII
jgi:hypothetical protein